MKKLFITILLMALVAAAHAQKEKSFSKEFLTLWKRGTAFTLAVAEAMPEAMYDYRPEEGALTFSQQLVHISENIYWLNSAFVVNEENPLGNDRNENPTKQEVIKQLKDAFGYVEGTLKNIGKEEIEMPIRFAGEEINKERIFYLMRDHMTHHRAQTMVYMRMNGIQPPRYVGW